MKFFSVVCFSFLFLQLTASGQSKKETYRLSSQIQSHLAADTLPWKNQLGAWDYSYMGDYQKALQTWDAQYPNANRKVTAKDSVIFAAYTPQNAKEYILNQATKEQILIINEAHHSPRHRVFTQSLLEDLYKKGYRYLGLEAVHYADTLLNQRGYPVMESGFYTREPQFGNLIREAKRLGYTVFGYDVEGNGKDREIGQARNIEKYLKKDPKAKMLIHCGFDHVNEGPSQAWEKAMAGRVKEFTGIDPFTIDQQLYTETSASRFDAPFFQLSKVPYSAVYLQKSNNQPFTGGETRQVDVALVHARTKLVNERPDWLWLDGRRKSFVLSPDKITVSYPALALAYKQDENEQAVPMDVVEFKSKTAIKPLILPPGAYRVILRDSINKQQVLQIQVK